MPDATLVVLVKRFPRRSETFVLNEVLELRRQGLPVQVVAIMDPHEAWAQPEATALVPEVLYLRTPGWSRLVPRLIATAARHPVGTARALGHQARRPSRAAARHLAEALLLVDAVRRQGRPVHVHAHFVHGPGASAYLARTIAGVPFSFTAHAKDLYTTDVTRVRERGAAAAFVVTCTDANRRYLEDVVGVDAEKVRVCLHGVDLRRFAEVARRPVAGRILSVGRLVPKKGFDVLIRACAALVERGVGVDCRIIGDGPMQAALEQLIDELGVAGHVRLEPGRPQPELLAAYAEAALFALPSTVQPDGDRDGIPNVLQEALAVGVPVVSTFISGIPELVRDGTNGRLVKPNDELALADAMEEMLSDDTLRRRMGTAARRLAAREASLQDRVRPLARQFTDALGAVSRRSERA
jgi:glycosyltransferase involved in cell wall biosynthesis